MTFYGSETIHCLWKQFNIELVQYCSRTETVQPRQKIVCVFCANGRVPLSAKEAHIHFMFNLMDNKILLVDWETTVCAAL